MNQSGVLLFDSFESYESLKLLSSRSNFKRIHSTVFIDGWKRENLESYAKSLLIHPYDVLSKSRQYFLLNDENKSLALSTLVTFQQPNCRQWKVIEINRFSKIDRKWKNGIFSVEKFRNYNGCKLVFALDSTRPPLNLAIIHDKKLRVVGYIPKIIEEISKNLNYSVQYNPCHRNGSFFYPSMPLDVLASAQIIRIMHAFGKEIISTHPIAENSLIIITSRFPFYTHFEKVFMPFENEVWNWLIGILIFKAVMIFAIGFAPKNVVNFIFGTRVHTPFLNMM